MKVKYPSILGILAVFFLVASLIGLPINTDTAQAGGELEWDQVNTPVDREDGDWMLAEDSDVGPYDIAADGKTMFGTQKSRPVWDVKFAELWELSVTDGETTRIRRLGDWDAVPLTLAQDSLSADVTTTMVDIGPGTSDDDYVDVDVKGKLVLTSSQPEAGSTSCTKLIPAEPVFALRATVAIGSPVN